MNTQFITFDIDSNQIARVTLNQPEKHNALGIDMMHELIETFVEIGENPVIRAVVLSGSGASFCAGGDLKWMQANLEKPRAERIAESKVLSALFEAINQCPKLVVGRINGPAYGGGVGLIAVCDIAIGVDAAKFALTEVRLGLVPANIMPYVVNKIGVAKLRRLALNARFFDGAEAVEIGLLDRVADADELDQMVDEELKLALAAAPNAIASTKRLISELNSGELTDPAAHLVEALADAWEHDEAQAGIRAFFDKKSAPWKP